MNTPPNDRPAGRNPVNADPRLLVFACRWCAAVGADTAGKERLDLPPAFRVIAVDCAGFVEPDVVIRALASDVDGVAVMGCHLGGCRFQGANHNAFKRLSLLQELLEATGLGRNRLQISFGTAHEGFQFAAQIAQFLDRLAQLKPLPAGPAPARTIPDPVPASSAAETRKPPEGP